MKLTKAVLGFRQWRLTNEGLMPQFYGKPWKAGINHAKCEHDCPQIASPGCSCGLYAWHTLEELAGHAGYDDEIEFNVHGAVAGWGRVTVHRQGWRAEKARILALAVEVESPVSQAVADTLSRTLSVPVVPFDMLQLQGAMFAEPVTEECKPEPPKPKKPKKKPLMSSYEQVLKEVWDDFLLGNIRYPELEAAWPSDLVVQPKPGIILPRPAHGDLLNELNKFKRAK